MINQTEVTIRLQHVSQGWFLWGEDDSGTPLSVTSWKRHAFTWHSTSFYGTFLKEATFEGKQGVLLTNAQAFEYIANKPMNSFAHIQLNGPITALTKDANELWDAFTSGSFVPDIEHWPKQPSWKVQNTPIEDNTLASLSQQQLMKAYYKIIAQMTAGKMLKDYMNITTLRKDNWKQHYMKKIGFEKLVILKMIFRLQSD